MSQSPWAILLCKFSDDNTEPFTVQHYQDLFTRSGIGTLNMVDYFLDMSHGSIDIGGSRVFGWYTLEQRRSDYTGSGANGAGRNQLVAWARQAAAADLGTSVGWPVVVCMNVPTDLFGGIGAAVCSSDNTEPSLLGQEMGHGYGLAHSRLDGSSADYMDLWDTMSTAAAFEAPHPTWTHVGPGLNAANMEGRGWLDSSRVITATGNAVFTLRPLHRRELAGFLACRVGEYLVEFRTKAIWDAAIPEPTVLVHRFEDNRSFLMHGASGQQSLRTGDVFEVGSNSPMRWEQWIRVEVTQIDAESESATLHVINQPRERPPTVGPGSLLGGLDVDGGGVVIHVGNRIIRVPPRSPVTQLIEHVATIAAAETVEIPAVRDVMLREGYSALASRAMDAVERWSGYHEPAPRRQSR